MAPPLSVAPARRRQTAEHLPPGQVAVIATNRNVPEPNRVVAFDMHRRGGRCADPSTVGLVPAGSGPAAAGPAPRTSPERGNAAPGHETALPAPERPSWRTFGARRAEPPLASAQSAQPGGADLSLPGVRDGVDPPRGHPRVQSTTPAPAVGWVGGRLHEAALDVAEGEPPAVPGPRVARCAVPRGAGFWAGFRRSAR